MQAQHLEEHSTSSNTAVLLNKGQDCVAFHFRNHTETVFDVQLKDNTNLYRFFSKTTPQVQLHTNPKSTRPFFFLADLWKAYDEPYGIEVSLKLSKQELPVYYVPHLSAIQLFTGSNPEPSVEFYETDSPEQRRPFLDRVTQVCKDSTNSRSDELDCLRSWYAVLWLPILCHNSTIPWIRGQIITYHTFVPSAKAVAETPVRAGEPHGYPSVWAFIPYKVRNETWFDECDDHSHDNDETENVRTFTGPVYMMRAAQEMLREREITHPDYNHCTSRCPDLLVS